MPPSASGEWPLVGRDDELARLDVVVGGDPGSAVVVGPPGFGKTRLVTDFLDRRTQNGTRVVLVRATRSASTIPFGAFAPWTPADRDGSTADDRLHILREVARSLVPSDARVVVAVDDAHLLDDGSATLLLHLAEQRAAHLIVTMQAGAACPDPITALWKEGLADRIDLRPLSQKETVEFVDRVLEGSVAADVHQRLWTLTTGVPLFLREVLTAGLEQGCLTWRSGIWRWQQSGSTTTGRLGELVGDRLARAGTAERRALELVAVAEPLPLALVGELKCIDALVRSELSGLVTTDVADHPTIEFAHPLHGEIVRAGMPPLVECTRRRELAEAALKVGWEERDPLSVASWCLESGSVTQSARLWLEAARQALACTECTLADRLARAAEAAGAGAEATLIRCAATVQLSGWSAADELLTQLSPDDLTEEVLPEYARLRAGLLAWNFGRPEAGRRVLAHAANGLSSPRRALVLVQQAFIAASMLDLEEASRLATDAFNAADRDVELRVQAVAVAALVGLLQGRVTPALRLAEIASPYIIAATAADPYPDNVTSMILSVRSIALMADGRPDLAAAVAQSALEQERDAMSQRSDWRHASTDHCETSLSATAVTLAGCIALFQGKLASAAQQARRAVAAATPGPFTQWPAAVLATAAAQMGDVTSSEKALAMATSAGRPVGLFARELAMARSWMTAVSGDLATARSIAADTAATAAAAGAWLLELFAMVELTRLGSPRAAVGRLDELVHIVDGRYAAMAAAYARAAARGEGHDLDRASAHFEAMGATLLAAEAAATAASAHQATGQTERRLTSLARARSLAAACEGPCTPALQEIHAPQAPEMLSDREQQVVGLAGQGLSNRQIAERLFISIRTVNAHLNHAYTKLGTRNRSLLATLLPLQNAEPFKPRRSPTSA